MSNEPHCSICKKTASTYLFRQSDLDCPAHSLATSVVNASLLQILSAPSRLQAVTHQGPAASSLHISQVIVWPVYGFAAGLPTGQI